MASLSHCLQKHNNFPDCSFLHHCLGSCRISFSRMDGNEISQNMLENLKWAYSDIYLSQTKRNHKKTMAQAKRRSFSFLWLFDYLNFESQKHSDNPLKEWHHTAFANLVMFLLGMVVVNIMSASLCVQNYASVTLKCPVEDKEDAVKFYCIQGG